MARDLKGAAWLKSGLAGWPAWWTGRLLREPGRRVITWTDVYGLVNSCGESGPAAGQERLARWMALPGATCSVWSPFRIPVGLPGLDR